MECSYVAGGKSWRIGDHPRRRDHSALFDGFGRVYCTFGAGDTLDDIKAALATHGLVVNDDNSVTRENGGAMP